MIVIRFFLLIALMFLSLSGRTLVIQKGSDTPDAYQRLEQNSQPINIAVISSSSVIGKYAHSTYNVALATLMSRHPENFTLKKYDLHDESSASLAQALKEAKSDGMNAVIAPLTANGAKNIVSLSDDMLIFIPTIHKRDIPSAPENYLFGGIDYIAQIEALLPFMSDSIAIFYDNSTVGMQLKSITEEVFNAFKSQKKKVNAYPVDLKGDNIVTHLSKPSLFNKSSIIVHMPVVKSALLTAHMTFTGVKEKNILSTQINIDPTLLTLTQYNDRKNMILANSLIEFPTSIYETNALMNNDLSNDWIQYATSVGTDYLYAKLTNTPREYSMRVIHSQVIYGVELLQAKEFGFEPISYK